LITVNSPAARRRIKRKRSVQSNKDDHILYSWFVPRHLQVNRAKDTLLAEIKASLTTPEDLVKVSAMLEDAQRRHMATGSALSEHISMHCAQLRGGLDDISAVLLETEAVKQRLRLIQDLCKRSDVLSASETSLAAVLAAVQVTHLFRSSLVAGHF
jgi:hypothetical protein